METLNFAIVGCGTVAQRLHIPACLKASGVNISAFVDIDINRAKAVSSRRCRSHFATIDELFKEQVPDAVVVCTSNAYHAPIAIKALNRNVHVLCEKPVAVNSDEARRMLQAEADSTASIMIAHNQRFDPVHLKARDILLSGELGRVLSFEASFSHRGPEFWSLDRTCAWLLDGRASDGGVLIDLGTHKIDLLQWLLGDAVREVTCLSDTVHKQDSMGNVSQVEDTALCLLKTAQGVPGSLSLNWTNYGKLENRTIFYCENGVLRLHDDARYDVIVDKRGAMQQCFNTRDMPYQDSAVAVIEAFAESIRLKRAQPITAEAGLSTLLVVEACLRSSGNKIIVPSLDSSVQGRGAAPQVELPFEKLAASAS